MPSAEAWPKVVVCQYGNKDRGISMSGDLKLKAS
jgi:hypothetical protein